MRTGDQTLLPRPPSVLGTATVITINTHRGYSYTRHPSERFIHKCLENRDTRLGRGVGGIVGNLCD